MIHQPLPDHAFDLQLAVIETQIRLQNMQDPIDRAAALLARMSPLMTGTDDKSLVALSKACQAALKELEVDRRAALAYLAPLGIRG